MKTAVPPVMTVVAPDERDLVIAARNGSSRALETIFDRYWTIVWRAAYAVTHRRELADDAAQDAFVSAGAALHRFDETRPLGPWLARIAVNRAIDLVRAEKHDEPLAEDVVSPSGEAATNHDLHAAVAALQRDRRAVVVLHFLLGFTLDETAEILEIPPGTAASRLSRALGDLHQTLEARPR
jgi:RNA polymerase sigma-70 factor (ECF subfamily)